MRRESEPKLNSRRKVLLAAVDEFARYGLAGARVDRIAKMAGVNKAMIYYYFESKEELYRAMFKEVTRQLDLSMSISMTAGDEIEDILMAMAKSLHDIFVADRRYTAIYLHEIASGGERLKTVLQGVINRRGHPYKLKKTINRGKRAGKLRDIDSIQAIVSFIGMNMFYLLLAPIVNSVWEIKNEKAFTDKRPAAVVDLFLHGLGK